MCFRPKQQDVVRSRSDSATLMGNDGRGRASVLDRCGTLSASCARCVPRRRLARPCPSPAAASRAGRIYHRASTSSGEKSRLQINGAALEEAGVGQDRTYDIRRWRPHIDFDAGFPAAFPRSNLPSPGGTTPVLRGTAAQRGITDAGCVRRRRLPSSHITASVAVAVAVTVTVEPEI